MLFLNDHNLNLFEKPFNLFMIVINCRMLHVLNYFLYDNEIYNKQ